jgi:mannose-6-phosphate isomerase-like protein (cupin superfamily)
MPIITKGVITDGGSIDGLVWDILGQTYRPVQWSEASFAFDTLFPPGTFVPPHIHPTQDEYIRVLDGEFELMLDGAETRATAGELVCMPMGLPHAIFNRSGAPVRALFWVAPSRRLFDLFVAINGVPDPGEVVRLSAMHEVDFLPPPGS